MGQEYWEDLFEEVEPLIITGTMRLLWDLYEVRQNVLPDVRWSMN